MNQFCVHSVTLAEPLRARHGVVRQTALLATADAQAAAAQLLQQAQLAAEQVRTAAQQEAQQALQQQQQQVARQATELLQGLQDVQQQLFAQVSTLVVELAQQTFERLLLEVTPRERIEAMLRRLLQEAPNQLVTPVLALHPDDAALAPASVWEIKTDATLKPGSCRLEAASGEWRAEFALAAAALREALGTALGPLQAAQQEIPADASADTQQNTPADTQAASALPAAISAAVPTQSLAVAPDDQAVLATA